MGTGWGRLTFFILAYIAFVHAAAELTSAETRDLGHVWLERFAPIPQLVQLNDLPASIGLQEFEDKLD